MKITLQIKLLPTDEQKLILTNTTKEYISLVNDILDYAIAIGRMPKLSSASLNAPLPSALKDQCRIDAKKIYNKSTKGKGATGKFPVLKKPIAVWNNQNYEVGEGFVAFPLWIDNKCRKTRIKAIVPEEVLETLRHCKRGTLRLKERHGKYIAQIAYEKPEAVRSGEPISMGIDLGLKCPAVAVTSDGKTRFYGNGRENKMVRRKFYARRKKLGKAKKLHAIKKSNDKEHRWMRDRDHKVSRAIVNDAIRLGVTTIKMENLSGIRNPNCKARKSRKNNRSIHTWSFYRLGKFIEYKARLAGIAVEYVDPAYTSQRCPHCGCLNHANDRNYTCGCGYHTHRDRVGAVNILTA